MMGDYGLKPLDFMKILIESHRDNIEILKKEISNSYVNLGRWISYENWNFIFSELRFIEDNTNKIQKEEGIIEAYFEAIRTLGVDENETIE